MVADGRGIVEAIGGFASEISGVARLTFDASIAARGFPCTRVFGSEISSSQRAAASVPNLDPDPCSSRRPARHYECMQ